MCVCVGGGGGVLGSGRIEQRGDLSSPSPPGGALRCQMATHCQTAARSGSGECQNIGAVNPFEGQKGGGQLQTKHLIRVVACKMYLFTLYFVKYMMFITLHALWNDWSPFFIQFRIEKV